MSTSKKQVQTRRRYSVEFRRARVHDFEKGTFSVCQMTRLYGMSRPTMYSWIEKYSEMQKKNAVIVEVANSHSEKFKAMEKQIADLQGALGRKQILLDFANAKLEYLESTGTDVKKKLSTMEVSNGSSSTTSKR